jgi:hypothetical protein
MPPQQCKRLLDFVDERLDFGAQYPLRKLSCNKSVHVSEATAVGKRRGQ